ncbi:MAG TPA: hypothetical protein VFX78_15115, partial [Candidatus Eisenbacteria bacterium]|nr:hypothetical protein [Candidatus Eisenbacteria bacterium]
VYERLVLKPECAHPEFDKVIGTLDHPHAAIVFGEKGAGKTALRLLIGRKIAEHNRDKPKRRVLLVPYDDLNPVLDLVARHRGGPGADALMKVFRLPDHQDAMLGIAVTRFLDALLGTSADEEGALLPADARDRLRRLPREQRVELAVLASLYDRPRSGNVPSRWQDVRRRLRLGWRLPFSASKVCAVAATVAAAGLFIAARWVKPQGLPTWALLGAGIAAAVAGLLWIVWLWRHLRLWNLVRKIRLEAPAVDRTAPQLRAMLRQLSPRDRANQPWPAPGGDGTNARYELTRKFVELLRAFDHAGMIVLIDRIDEPTLVAGRPERMRELLWPLFESKFLQQEGVGVKMLLPIELRYLVHKEGSDFFQEARLDKQSVVDRLAWSGATLYDLCTARIRACHNDRESRISLSDLFAEDVGREALVNALGQMAQPRDAFKLLYSAIREHCQRVGEEDGEFRVPRFILDSVRKEQAQRVSELQRGLSPG